MQLHPFMPTNKPSLGLFNGQVTKKWHSLYKVMRVKSFNFCHLFVQQILQNKLSLIVSRFSKILFVSSQFFCVQLREYNKGLEYRLYHHLSIQQGLEIHGLKECGPWRCTVFNWFPKHLRYTDFGQKP